MRKTFNSDTARELAKKNKLKLSDISTHRADNKVTIQDVKNAMKSKPSSKKPSSKVQHLILIKPYVLAYEGEGDGEINYDKNNLSKLVRWWTERGRPGFLYDIDDFKVGIQHDDAGILYIRFKTNILKDEDLEILYQLITDPDDDGNYPIYIKNRKIVSIDRDVEKGGEPVLVSSKVVEINKYFI